MRRGQFLHKAIGSSYLWGDMLQADYIVLLGSCFLEPSSQGLLEHVKVLRLPLLARLHLVGLQRTLVHGDDEVPIESRLREQPTLPELALAELALSFEWLDGCLRAVRHAEVLAQELVQRAPAHMFPLGQLRRDLA
jgi:hypothetical protein